MPDEPPARLIACWCPREDDPALAVVELTPDLARGILARRAELLRRKAAAGDGLDWLEFSSPDCRFFDEAFTDEPEAVDALFEAAREAFDAAGEDNDAWFALPWETEIPDRGDYRTAYEQLKVGEVYICWNAAGKHGGEEFETADLPLDLLREAAGVDPAADRDAAIAQLRTLDAQADALRAELGLDRRDASVTRYTDPSGEREIEVLADGYGRFRLLVTEGRNPHDRLALADERFDDRDAACAAARSRARAGEAGPEEDNDGPDG